MSKLILKMIMSLDGFVAGPEGEVSWMSGFDDEEALAWEVATLWNAQAHLMGSRTFQDMKCYWPEAKGPIAEAMNALPKITFSRSGLQNAKTTTALQESIRSRDAAGEKAARSPDADSWDRPEVLSGDLVEEVRKLKHRDGKPLLVHGGAGFARGLIAANAIDEFRLLTYPVALGRGLGIFDKVEELRAFDQTSLTRFESGVTAAILTPRGKKPATR